MYCNNCGKQIPDNGNVCAFCGCQIQTVGNSSMNGFPGYNAVGMPGQYVSEPVKESVTPTENPVGPDGKILDTVVDPHGKTLGMKWFKFILYGQLFISIALRVLSGVFMLTGLQYGGKANREVTYLFFDKLKAADIIFGIVIICVALYGFHVRKRLAAFGYDGPSLYYRYYFINLGVLVAYLVVCGIITHSMAPGTGAYIQFAEAIIMLIANHTYFSNRAFLFGKYNLE